MANLIKYNVDTAWTSDSTFVTNINSLTNTSTAVGSAITNGTNLAMILELGFILGSITPTGSPYVEIHVVPLLGDGTTYADFAAGGPTLRASLSMSTAAAAKNLYSGQIIIPPGTFKGGLVNETGVTLAASGNSAWYRLTDYTNNG